MIYTDFSKIDKKYSIIYADPPWAYDDKLSHHGGSAESHYTVMSDSDIASLPVRDIADKDAILFMWITGPKMAEGAHIQIFKRWGFVPKTIGFVWNKTYPDGSPITGMGQWTRSSCEYCLLARRGKIPRVGNNVPQFVPRPLKHHSRKPDIVRRLIEDLVGGNREKIELFARTPIHGWDVVGNDPKLLTHKPLEAFQ